MAIDVSPVTVVSTLRAPVLFLHALDDEVTPVRDVWHYEQTMHELGKPVESHDYDTGGHRLPFARATQDDVLRRSSEFLKRHLQP